jgi:uncharacterized protein (TIGR03437 family)
MDGANVPVLSAKLAEHAAGVYEVRIVVPAGMRSRTEPTLAIAQNGIVSNTVTFPVTSR